MTIVTITRTTDRYRRTINGAWVGGGSEQQTFEIDEEKLRPTTLDTGVKLPFSINSGIVVTWPDGTRESAFPFNGGAFAGYPPICYPGNGRLAELLK